MAMSTVKEWKAEHASHGDGSKNPPLTKALESYERVAGRSDPSAEIESLDLVIDRAEAAKKEYAKTKPLVSFLSDLIKDAKALRSKAEKEAEDQDEEGDGTTAAGVELKSRLLKIRKIDKDNARPFVLALGEVSGLVIGRTKSITAEHRKRAKAMRTGKGRVLNGLCYSEKGKYVFAFEMNPPGGLTKAIKKTAKLVAELPSIRLKVRGPEVEIDDEDDNEELTDFGPDDDDAPAIPKAPPPPSTKKVEPVDPNESSTAARVRARLPLTRAAVAKLKALDPAAAVPLTEDFDEAARLVRLAVESAKKDPQGSEGHFAAALLLLNRVDDQARVLAKASSAGDSDTAEGAAEWSARLAELTPEVDDALKIKGERSLNIKLLFSQAQTAARKLDFLRGLDLLDQVETALNAPLNADDADEDEAKARAKAEAKGDDDEPEETPPPPVESNGDVLAKAIYARRLKSVVAQAKRVGVLSPAVKAAAARAVARTEALVKRGKPDEAMAVLDRIEAMTRAAMEAAGPDVDDKIRRAEDDRNIAKVVATETEDKLARGTLKPARDAWKAARRAVDADLAKLLRAFKKTFPSGPEGGQADRAGEKIRAAVSVFNDTLGDRLADAIQARDPGDRARQREAALKLVSRYRRVLDSSPLLQGVDDNPFAPVSIHGTLAKTLTVLENALGQS